MNARRTLARPLLAVLALLVAVCALAAPTQARAEDSSGFYLRCDRSVVTDPSLAQDPDKQFAYDLYVTTKDKVPLNETIEGLEFVDGWARLTLKPDGSIHRIKLPAGAYFTVTQQADRDYDTAVDGVEGLSFSGRIAVVGGWTSEPVVFQNTLNPAPAQFSPAGLTKTLTGGTLAAGAYEYKMVVTGDGAQVAERGAANAADGSITFEAVDLASVGTYHVTVTELGDASTAGHSDNVLEMDVVVSQRGSSLVCESAVTSGSLTFAGTISPEPQPEPVTPVEPDTPATPAEPAKEQQAKALPQTGESLTSSQLMAVSALIGLSTLCVGAIRVRR